MRMRIAIIALSVLLTGANASAADWIEVTAEADLKRLFSDTQHTAMLKDGVSATSTYHADGTGELKAWGKAFARKWKIDDGEACILIDGKWNCFDIERSQKRSNEYRATNPQTRERVVFQAQGKTVTIASPSRDGSGGDVTPSVNEVAKELANPNTPLATLTLKTQYRSFDGDLPGAADQTSLTFLLQPSFPFPAGESGVVFFRPAVPLLIDQPVFDANSLDFNTKTGLGDIGFDLGYGTTDKNGVLLAGGIASTLPTATRDVLGSDKWRLGPEALAGVLRPYGVLGLFPNHQWSVTGSGNETSLTTVQFIVIGLPGGGWNIGTKPIVTYDWKSEEWTVPLNAAVGKTVILNGRPWKLGIEVNYYVDKPNSFGPRTMVEFNVGPVVENALARIFE